MLASRFETPGRYRRWLRINRWKDKVPEAGGLFRGGARELLFLDGREPIRNLAVSASELERAARALHDAVSG